LLTRIVQFWKQFFEASANVSLSGYEELANDDESSVAEESTAMRDDTTADYTAQHDDDDATRTTTPAEQSTLHGDESLLDDAELTGSTPRPPATKTIRAQLSPLESPYEALKREMANEEDAGATTVLEDDDDDEEDSTVLFAQRTARLPDMSMTPRGLGGALGDRTPEQSTQRPKDPLLHRVLDKNYRLQATPHKPAYRISPLKKPTMGALMARRLAHVVARDGGPDVAQRGLHVALQEQRAAAAGGGYGDDAARATHPRRQRADSGHGEEDAGRAGGRGGGRGRGRAQAKVRD